MNLTWTTHPLALLINALLAYRLTRLWTVDMLPPIPRVRHWIADKAMARWLARHQTNRTVDGWQELSKTERIYEGTPALTHLVECAWCSGFWISLGVFLGATFVPATLWTFVAVPFALSALVGLIAARTP